MDWNQDVQSYLEMVLQGGIPEEDRPSCCPHCGQKEQVLHRHGKYPRKVFTLDKESVIPVFRFYCPLPQCRKTVNMIPDFVKKHQQVGLDIQEQVIQSHDEGQSLADLAEKTETLPGGAYSEKTLWRWTKNGKELLRKWESQVWEWILGRFPHIPLPQGQARSKWGWFFKVWEYIRHKLPDYTGIHFLHWLHRFSQAMR